MPAVLSGVLAFAAALATASPAAAPPPCPACVTWEVDAARAAALLAGDESLANLRLLVRAPLPAAVAGGPTLVQALSARGAVVMVRLDDGAASAPGPDEALADAVGVLLPVPAADPRDADGAAFRVKSAVTRLRARRPGLRVGLEGDPGALQQLFRQGLGAYADFVLTDGAPTAPPFGGETWMRGRLGSAAAAAALLQAGSMVLVPWPRDPTLASVPFALADAQAALAGPLAPAPLIDVECVDTDGVAHEACAASAYLADNGDVSLLVTPSRPLGAVRLRTGGAGDGGAGVTARLIPLTRRGGEADLAVAAGTAETRVALAALTEPALLVVRGWSAAQGLFGSGVDVVGRRLLTVEEVLARHQAAAARQRRLLPTAIASGTLLMAFQAPGLSAPMTVTADVTLFTGPGGTDVEERGLRLNGVSLEGRAVPRLPIVEPERVAVPPLALVLGPAYRYALRGVEDVGGRPCYRLSFASRPGVRPGLHGEAWIEAGGFALARLHSVQTGLRGPIVGSEQTDTFAPVEHGGERVWMLARSTVHQAYEGPGFRTTIERVVDLPRREPAPADFAQRLASAHAGPAVMLRETAQGFEYLEKPPAAAAGAPAGRTPAGRATAVRTVALGVIVDPNIGDPLPFAGAGYSDLDFLHSGTQLSAFLAGPFAQLSWQVPSLLGGWTLQAAGQASLVAYNDRVFRRGLEQYGENLRQRPARFGLLATHALGGRVRVQGGYELEYTRLRGSDLTASDFALPDSHLAHGLRLGLDARRGAWSASAWWRAARRPRWKAWGLPGDEEGREARASFQRFGATLARTFIAGPRLLLRAEATALGGRGLDRFSRYTFDGFENRLAGYPLASVRFDRGLVAHGLVSWRARPALRLQLLADGARVRDAGFANEGRTLVGLGLSLEATLPARSLLSVEWGYGPDGLDRDGHRGTQTLRVTAYRVF